MFEVDVDGKQYYVSFRHLRNQSHDWGMGITGCRIRCLEDGAEVGTLYEESLCSRKDSFSRAVGRKEALARVLRKNFPRDQRSVFWHTYFQSLCSSQVSTRLR